MLSDFLKDYLPIIIFLFLVVFYVLQPITKQEEENFKNKNNWRGGF